MNAQVSQVWVADNGDGTYHNPVLHADYSDPDAVRVGEDYYMTSSSFNHIPGLPLLHSKDMVNWQLVGYALKRQPPFDHFSKVQHGMGVWAPSIRFHNNAFYIYYPDPDFGIYLVKAKEITGPWSEPILVQAGKGFIDPCPLWDNDKVYLAHAYAASRAGIKSVIALKELSADGTKTITDSKVVYDGHESDPTIEGPKLYKRNNYYYIFAPAGGVPSGWQVVLRSKDIYGPYERKVVMDQGTTDINGPHQGAWLTTPSGEDWFLHFQDKKAYGRVVHLQPMKWVNDWPVIGIDSDGNGTGEPVLSSRKPHTEKIQPIVTPPDSDEFNSPLLGLQWQWQANPEDNWLTGTGAGLHLNAIPWPDTSKSYWRFPALLLQKFPAEEFTATTKLSFQPAAVNDRAGFMIFGNDYAFLSLTNKEEGLSITMNTCLKADKNETEKEIVITKTENKDIFFRVSVKKDAICTFSFSRDGKKYKNIRGSFKASQGRWVGAKIGFFCSGTPGIGKGFVIVDWIRFTK